MSFQESMTRAKSEALEAATVGVGLIAQALSGLSGVLHHAAQAMEQVSETLISKAIDEEFVDDLVDREEDEDAKDAEDSVMDEELEEPLGEDPEDMEHDLDTPSWLGPETQPAPPVSDPTGAYEPPRLDPLT